MKKFYQLHNPQNNQPSKKFETKSLAREAAALVLTQQKASQVFIMEAIEVVEPKEVPVKYTETE